jgi:DNA (cytosine-5)-methyltransferase 1
LRGYLETGNKKRKSVAADAGASAQASRINCQPDGISGAVTSKWSKGSGGPAGDEHYNMITQPVSHWEGGNVHPTLNQSAKGSGGVGSSNQELFSQGGAYLVPGQPIPIQDGREIEKHQNGMGVGNPGDPAYTIDTTGAQAAGVPFRKSKRACSTTDNERVEAEALAITFQPGNLRREAGADPSFTTTTTTLKASAGDQTPHVAYPVVPLDGMNLLSRLGPCGEEHSLQNFEPGDPSFTLKKGGNQHGVLTPMAVRRLTPVECERLQGFPDNWSRISWKGKPEEECPDGPRYKACGNSMAVPVMAFIGRQIAAVDSTLSTHA